MKARFAPVLDSLGLLLPVFRGIEFFGTLAAGNAADGPDGLPVPPAILRMRVAGTKDVEWFLERGGKLDEAIRKACTRGGAPLESRKAILDFGCGCGGVLRRWQGLNARICGTDLYGPAVKWCATNLPFAEVGVNGLEPPLDYADASFDLVCAVSVFTHLPLKTQFAWLDELRRVLRLGGDLLMTLHGDENVWSLKPKERAVYEAGGCVVRWPKAAGSNLCAAYHSPRYVRERLAEGWELINYTQGGAGGLWPQDIVVLRKPVAPHGA